MPGPTHAPRAQQLGCAKRIATASSCAPRGIPRFVAHCVESNANDDDDAVVGCRTVNGCVDKANGKPAEPLRQKQLGGLCSSALRVFHNDLGYSGVNKALCQCSLPRLVHGDIADLKKTSAVGRHKHDKDVLQPAVVEDALFPVRVKHIPHNKRTESVVCPYQRPPAHRDASQRAGKTPRLRRRWPSDPRYT